MDDNIIYVLDFEDYDEGFYFMNNIDDLTIDWQKQYPIHRYTYETIINEDKSVSIILNIFVVKDDK